MRYFDNLIVYRRVTQIAFVIFIFLVPALDIFRFDTHTKELIILGHVWGLGLKQNFYADPSVAGAAHVAFHFLFNAVLPWVLVLAVFPLLGYLTGRLFCGWLCPEGAMFELVDFFSLKLLGRRGLYGKKPNDPDVKPGNRFLYGALALATAVALPLIAGIALTGYFIAPKTIWHQISTGDLSFGVKAGITGVTVYMFVTSVLVRHIFCKYICAAGLMQMLFGWISPVSLRVKMDTVRRGECTDCMGCERACFMNVLPRMNKRDISCVNCGACIAACNKELGPGRGLFHFSIGEGCVAPQENCRNLEADSAIPLAERSTGKVINTSNHGQTAQTRSAQRQRDEIHRNQIGSGHRHTRH
ncbi:MAG: 4Fe-4S binding protein [Geobacter sp.]|nr:MAG: 4Fe-4S binding protein [Geobacter sp.]